LKIEEQDALLLKIQTKLGKTKAEVLSLILNNAEPVVPFNLVK
jgi:hypothetical protein